MADEQLTLLPDGRAERVAADQAERDLVRTTLDRTLFVEAGAGSGKTRALVDRIEQLVLSGVQMESIAAITFTEKAAAELSDRIRQRLESRASGGVGAEVALATTALQQLDGAAVGTLHSFAQRVLGDHPVEAGLPPGVEVLDEIGSQVEFDLRWSDFVDRLLDDPSLGRSLLVLETAKVKLDHLRALALMLGANWDLVDDRLPLHPPDPPPLDTAALVGALDDVLALEPGCTATDDTLLARFEHLHDLRHRLDAAVDDFDALDVASRISGLTRVGNKGKKANWPDVAAVRDAVRAVGERADHDVAAITTAALRRIAGALGSFVLEAAELRRTTGRLEFHDLLVRARRLLRDPVHGPEVRRALRDRYTHLLLDEFQDTDPIQVELAVLIASPEPDIAGRDWTDLPVDDGRVFFVGDPKQSIYRFRRADIGVFLAARERFADRPALTVNFRTVAPVITWVNHVFSSLITPVSGSQPEYVALDAHRRHPPEIGPPVALLGAEPHLDQPDAATLRERESLDVAGAVATALHEGWSVDDGTPDEPQWRPARPGDICILLPARTSLPFLERALDRAGIPYRAETSSLVYASREIRELLLALRAVGDPTDELATVAALRSAIYGCGDDDLAHWRLGLNGRFNVLGELPDGSAGHPVAEGLRHLGALHEARLWSTPAELLDRLVRERGLMETAVATGRPRDVWRRLRFVVDQARAWVDAGGTDLRAYLRWARLQGADNARVSETVLPETDDDSVRILTIHGAKGLEFPITVMAGMTTELQRAPRGPVVAFPPGDDPVIKIRSGVESEGFDAWKPIDDQMDEHERIRLLYVAATRAKDHLVVCLHRKESAKPTIASVLADQARSSPDATALSVGTPPLASATAPIAAPLPDRAEWAQERHEALSAASVRTVVSATTVARETADAHDPGLAKRVRDLDLPPWQKGRYGTAVGRAVHGVLQVVDLATGEGLEEAAAAQAVAEGVANRTTVVERLARAGLESTVARQAATRRHWRELWVAAPVGDRLVEGYVDLLFRSDDGLVVVDWKTDHLAGDDDVAAKLARYRLQGASYVAAVEAATGEPVVRMVFVFLGEDGPTEAELPDLRAGVDEVRERVAELAASAPIEPLAEL